MQGEELTFLERSVPQLWPVPEMTTEGKTLIAHATRVQQQVVGFTVIRDVVHYAVIDSVDTLSAIRGVFCDHNNKAYAN